MLTLHIGLAIISILSATCAMVKPSKSILSLTYCLTASVLVSGLILATQMPQQLGHLCFSGFIYLSLIIASLKVAKKRLTYISLKNHNF